MNVIQELRQGHQEIESERAANESQIVAMQNQMEALEAQAQEELDDMHDQLLTLRQQCHDLQLSLKESEAKRWSARTWFILVFITILYNNNGYIIHSTHKISGHSTSQWSVSYKRAYVIVSY